MTEDREPMTEVRGQRSDLSAAAGQKWLAKSNEKLMNPPSADGKDRIMYSDYIWWAMPTLQHSNE